MNVIDKVNITWGQKIAALTPFHSLSLSLWTEYRNCRLNSLLLCLFIYITRAEYIEMNFDLILYLFDIVRSWEHKNGADTLLILCAKTRILWQLLSDIFDMWAHNRFFRLHSRLPADVLNTKIYSQIIANKAILTDWMCVTIIIWFLLCGKWTLISRHTTWMPFIEFVQPKWMEKMNLKSALQNINVVDSN